MDNEYKYISRIENFLSMLMAKSGASKQFFVSHFPEEINKNWKDLVYADLNPSYEHDAYAVGSVNIFLYSRPEGSLYRKDVKAMLAMEEAMEKAIRENDDDHYVLTVNWRDSDWNAQIGFFFNVINVSITIK